MNARISLMVVVGLFSVQAWATDDTATASNAPAATRAVPSTGLLNSWLRTESPAWQQVDLGGQLRIREQARENAGPVPNNDFIRNNSGAKDNSDTCLLTRETGHIGYTPVSWLTLFAEGRNSDASHDNRNPNPDADRFDLHQAYLRLGDLYEFPLQLKVGRQEMEYGDQRLVGISDWSNVGRMFDAAKVRYEEGLNWVEAFIARPVYVDNDHFDTSNPHEKLSGVYASSKALVPWQDTQLYFLSYNVDHDSPTFSTPTSTGPNARDVYSFGTLCKSLPHQLQGWDYSAELMMQTGSLTTNATKGARLDLLAYSAVLRGGFTAEQTWAQPRLGLEFDYGSGDNNAKDGKDGTLQDLFPTRHGRCGYMDLFSPRNMEIPRVNFSLQPVKPLKLTAEYLMYWLADTNDGLYPESGSLRNQNGFGIHPTFNSFVGSELDLVANYSVLSWLNFQVGCSHFFVGDYIKECLATVPANGGAVAADWVYTQVTLNF